MSHRAEQLQTTADTKITELIDLIRTADEPTLHRPCPGREKLGDGTIGASASHAAANYQRIGTFVATAEAVSLRHNAERQGRYRIPAVTGALGRTPPDDSRHAPVAGRHDQAYTASDANPCEIVERLAAARAQLARIAELTDQQLDSVPPKDSFRFCDGERTLEQVLAGLLKHQDHQVQALRAALTSSP
jgi:hypothetical protein